MKLPVFLLLTLLCITGTIELQAQTPPMPPTPTVKIESNPCLTNTVSDYAKTFTVTCPACRLTFNGLRALTIITNGWRQTPDDKIIYDRTVTLGCPNAACRKAIKAANQKVVPLIPETIATEDEPLHPMGSGGTSTVLPDTNAPTVIITNLNASKITDFTNQVPVNYTIDTHSFYWLDALTGQQVTKAFEFRFQALSNHFYTVWICSPLSSHASNWIEYPSDRQLHPARGDFLAGLSVPIYETNRFYAIRAFNGGNRVTWQ